MNDTDLQLFSLYSETRRWTAELCDPLIPEDFVIQSMPDASPAKWHLAHTSWFFETFLLKPHLADYSEFNPQFNFLFNSYYNALGPRHARPSRGLLSRPSTQEIFRYRAYVDEHMAKLVGSGISNEIAAKLEIGINHEQQHQELLLTDIKHAFSVNPVLPVYKSGLSQASPAPVKSWVGFGEELYDIGHDGTGFAFDNEGPRHIAWIPAFELSSHLVTNQEFREFIAAGAYENPVYWLSDGWTLLQREHWRAPLYWLGKGDDHDVFSLRDRHPVRDSEPVCHLSFFEADAYARWVGARLPTEQEWEVASASVNPQEGEFLESRTFHPGTTLSKAPLAQMFGSVWQWTSSAYLGYPGYQPVPGALGEYNGKFMCNQFVLRGGSVATPANHIRRTYRNFFPPDARWQFSGLRLARWV
jgi:ergothioneine biosynthesis protein EgtB